MTAVYRTGDGVLVERPGGTFLAVDDVERYVRFTLPADAVELLDPDDGRDAVLADVAAALADVKMSKSARRAVAEVLDGLGDAA